MDTKMLGASTPHNRGDKHNYMASYISHNYVFIYLAVISFPFM